MSSAQVQCTVDTTQVLQHYPAPIALAYAGLDDASSALERLFALKDLFEVALKYCAIVMVQDYLRLGVQSTPVDSAIVQFLPRPQLGNWNHILREIARACQGEREQLFIPELADFYFEPWGSPRHRGHELVDALLKFRNSVIAHSARPRGREAEEIFQNTSSVANEFISDLSFLHTYDLVSEGKDGTLVRQMGAAASRQQPDPQLYLMRQSDKLPLTPLLLLERCNYSQGSKICDQTKFFFFNGGDRRPEYLDYLMGHVKQAPAQASALQSIITGCRERLHVEMVSPSMISSDLMHDVSRGFVGRLQEEEQILSFIQTNIRGQVLIVGDPGIGKSALLSQVVIDLSQQSEADMRSHAIAGLSTEFKHSGLAVASHVCTRRVPESTTVPTILESLAQQLVKQYGPATTMPQERSLRALLDLARIAKSHFQAKALLVIDGVDEILAGRSAQEQREILASLPINTLLPDGVFALVSSRRGYIEPTTDTCQLELSGLTGTDIRSLLAELSEPLSIEEKHVESMLQVSQGNSLYIRMLLNDLKGGQLRLDQIDRLPQGLEGYFEDFIKRLSIDNSWPAVRDCLLLFAIARSHLSVNQVCAIIDLTWAEAEEAVEDKLQPVLVAASSKVRDFQLFHEKFREFLLALFSAKAPGETLARLNRHFVREAPQKLRSLGEVALPSHLDRLRTALLDYCRRWQELDDEYPLRNLPWHLYEGGQIDELQTLLSQTKFAEHKFAQLGESFPVAEDFRYLTLGLLDQHHDDAIVELGVTNEGFQRDGVTAALRVAGPQDRDRALKIGGELLRRADPSPSVYRQNWQRLRIFFPGQRTPQPEIMNARRTAIEVSYRLRADELLVRASRDDSPAVQSILVPYLYRAWRRDQVTGWVLLDRISEGLQHRWGLPNARVVEAYGGLCMAILIYHSDEPEVLERLQSHWRVNVRRLLHIDGGRSRTFFVRTALRGAIFVLTRMLRLLMASQPDFQPINLREMAASMAKSGGTEQRFGLQALESLEHPERGFQAIAQMLLNRDLEYGVYLMLVVERTLIFHGARDPDGVMQALVQLHREGCEWFRPSALYVGYHLLNLASTVEDEWLDTYALMTRETVTAKRATFETPTAIYDLLPHIAASEIILNKHRPAGRAVFIPEFYAEARRLNDMQYAKRVIGASSLLSFGYRQHELALDALKPALADRERDLRDVIVDALAGIRFHAEDAVERFLKSENASDLAGPVSARTLSVKSNDIFGWIDQYTVQSLVTSDSFRAEIVGAFRRAGHARSLPQLLQQILKWVINLSTGEQLLPL